VRNEEVLHRVKEERNIIHTMKRKKANWTGHILSRNCLIKYLNERKERRQHRQDGNTRKKTQAATG
jgi:hypothetical protein